MHIRLQDLHISFGKVHVLRGLDLEVEPGEVCVILGGSGSGKSVTLKLLLRLLVPDQGTVQIDGIDITHMPEGELTAVRRRFGVIFQSGGLLASLSVAENVALGLVERTRVDPARIAKIVAEKLQLVGLGGREAQDPATLSGGQRKRAAIARALTMKSECFLLDEPTAGLDPPTSRTIEEVLARVLKSTGASMILVTHDLVTAFRLGTRIHLLYEGRIVASGTPEEFRASTHPMVREFLARDGGSEPEETTQPDMRIPATRGKEDSDL